MMMIVLILLWEQLMSKHIDYRVHDMVERFTNDMWFIGNVRDNYISMVPRYAKRYLGGNTIMWGGITSWYFLAQLSVVFSILVILGITVIYYTFSEYSRTKHGRIMFSFHNNTMFCDGVVGYDKTRIRRITKKMKIDVVFSHFPSFTRQMPIHFYRRR